MAEKKASRSSNKPTAVKDKEKKEVAAKSSFAKPGMKKQTDVVVKKAKSSKVIRKVVKKKTKNPETVLFKNKEVGLKNLLKEYEQLKGGVPNLNSFQKKAIRRYHREEALKPYQAELIRLMLSKISPYEQARNY